jgi:hypothetical protein
MKKLISLALISGVMVLPTIASAAGEPTGGPYKNKGQCESGLSVARNDARKADGNPYTPSEFNALIHEHYSCEQAADGSWYWVFT